MERAVSWVGSVGAEFCMDDLFFRVEAAERAVSRMSMTRMVV